MTIRERIQIWLKGIFPAQGGRSIGGKSWLSGTLPGTRIDWQRTVGDRWRSSSVAIALNWIIESFPEAKPCLKKLRSDGEYDYDSKHPLIDLLKRPNEIYSFDTMIAGTVISLKTDGNAYWLKVRNRGNGVAELWYLPHFFVDPQGPEDGSVLIDRYAYTVNGTTQFFDVKDIVHIRSGMNPRDMRRGWSPLAEQDRQIAGDNEASTYQAALLMNFGCPGMVVSPSTDKAVDFDPEDGERLKNQFSALTTGDNRGRPIIIPAPIKVEKLGFSPEELSLDKLMMTPVERIFGALGLDPMVAGQPSDSKTYSNYAEATSGGWENCILPLMAKISSAITYHLCPDFRIEPDIEFGFDVRNVKALQADFDKLYERLVKAAGGPVITPNEARAQLNYPKIDGGDELRQNQPPHDPSEEDDRNGASERKSSDILSDEWAKRMLAELDNIESETKNNPNHGDDGRFSSGGGGGVEEQTPTKRTKSEIAKQTSRLVGKDIQQYSEEHCEPILAKGVGGLSLRDNEPVDVIVVKEGKVQHGIELKTMTDNKNGKITMKGDAIARKAKWVQDNRAQFHTVVFDDQKVYDANGKGSHADSKREIYYRRGAGSYSLNTMHKVKDFDELNTLLNTETSKLPQKAKPLPTYQEPGGQV